LAERGLTAAIGDALVALVDWAWPRDDGGSSLVLDKLADALRPDPPLTIRSDDGQFLTGVLVADHGRVLLFLGTRTTAPTPIASPHEQPLRRFKDDAIPPWARDLDVDPYRR
jgi:hypothetical protein